MDSRRNFLKKAALLAAGGGLTGSLASIQRALAIDPISGSTWRDAEHVVILMQENRSFDHSYGTLRGVRGFNDPRAITLPDGNPVWLQSNARGETYAPFRLNIKDSKATWMGSLPHARKDQVEARNDGRHDRWLDVKPSGHTQYSHLPLTLGFHNREDIPFYYSLADAFTVCDQNFCSSLTGTTPNRLYLWTGTIREKQSFEAKANVHNENVEYNSEVSWKTFPERLQEHGVSWRIYQNEITVPTGLSTEAEAWLSNFGDNPIEWFTQYHVRFSATHRAYLVEREKELTARLATLEAQRPPLSAEIQKKRSSTRIALEQTRRDLATWTQASFDKLTPREQDLHRRAFTTNTADPNYRELTTLRYRDGDFQRTLEVPKGDVLHQFREDVRSGKLPTVSWIVAPANFSDHPSYPWYGTWYLSETLDILTQNPEVWRKTIFVLCYDENDGYFDHVPPFVPPRHDRPGTGKVSVGIDTSVEYENPQHEGKRADPIGLGFRVPLVIASPWSRGGYVCSEVFDHTSILQFLEQLVSHKTGKPIRETNLSAWRRTVCGDLTSVFRPYGGEKIETPQPVKREPFLESIHQAQFKQAPEGYHKLTADEIALIRENRNLSPWMPRQEKGIRPSCALPYELSVDGRSSPDRKSFVIEFAADKKMFGERASGAPFRVYAPSRTRRVGDDPAEFEAGRSWDYAVSPGDRLSDTWSLSDFEDGRYHLRVHGPNGFFREFRGSEEDPLLAIQLEPEGEGNWALLTMVNSDVRRSLEVLVEDLNYGSAQRNVILGPASAKGAKTTIKLDLNRSFGWYDLRIQVKDAPQFARRYSGRVETGMDSFSDPAMGEVSV